MKHGLLLFFNHPYRKVRLFLEKFYGDRFDEVHVLTPPESSGEESLGPAITYYYHGSYNFAGAYSYLQNRTDLFAGMDWITVLHDDVVLNPAFLRDLERIFAENPGYIAARPWSDAELEQWLFNWRLVARVFFSRDPVLGEGHDDPLHDLHRLYAASHAPGGQTKKIQLNAANLFNPGGKGATTRKFLFRHGSLTADFGVPLQIANSDLFIVRRDRFDSFCHGTGVLSRCGMFAEVAVPTALAWLADSPAYFDEEQLHWDYHGFDFQISRPEDIPAYFEQHPRKLAIHPVKMSKLLS